MPVRIPGVLHTDSKVKYGSEKGKLIYLFEPYDQATYGNIYVPSKYMHQSTKKYAYVECDCGEGDVEQRRGVVIDYLGDVGDLEAEYLYLKYVCQLQQIKPLKSVATLTTPLPTATSTQYKVYSIDPRGCRDIDDAFHYDGSLHQIGIHIAYPWKFLAGGENNKTILETFLQRVSTLYMPTKIIPMMYPQIAEDLASLLEKTHRYAITILYQLDEEETTILGSEIHVETVVYVVKNYDYETVDGIFALTSALELSAKERMLRTWREVSQRIFQKSLDAHQVVEAWMIYTNQTVGTHLVERFGDRVLLRTMQESPFSEKGDRDAPEEIQTFLKMVGTEGAEYQLYDASRESEMQHALMGSTTYYTHFTSPIRRFCDLYLQALLGEEGRLPEDFQLLEEDIAHINQVTRSMRKYQRMCQWTDFIYQATSSMVTAYAYIYQIDWEKRRVRLYFGKEMGGITLKKSVVQKRFEEITEVEWDEGEKRLRVKDEDGTQEYRLYERRRVRIYLYPNRHRLQDRVEVFFCE